MPEVSVNVDVWCSQCHDGLCNDTDVKHDSRHGSSFHVAPCKNCMENARREGFDEGFDEGYAKGYDDREAAETAKGTDRA